MSLTQIQKDCYGISADHGFHKRDAQNLSSNNDSDSMISVPRAELENLQNSQRLMLIASEISEAFEELREGHAATEIYYNNGKPDKPEGFPIELADAMIRIWDTAETYGVDLEEAIKIKMEYNKSRPYKHGKKF